MSIAAEDRPPVMDVIDTDFPPGDPKEAFESLVRKQTIKPMFDVQEFKTEA